MMPIPPSRAIWMAILASVTVSMAADTSGICRRMFAREERGHGGVLGVHQRMARNQEDVVEGETFSEDSFR